MATTGEWGGLQIRFDIPELTDAITVVDSVFEIVIVALDIALTVLNVIKSFVSSLLNPVRAIIQELIAAIQNLLLDFRQAGFYANGDWNLLGDTTLEQLKGGYSAYQNRMITRLTDLNDYNRPTFTPSTTVLALFLYTGADISFVNKLADFSVPLNTIHQLIDGFSGFFGIDINNSSLPVPMDLKSFFTGGASRTASDSSITDLRASVSRSAGRISTILQWKLSPSPGSDASLPLPVVPPDGFLIEVSVWPKGLYAGYLAPTPGSTGGVAGIPNPESTDTPAAYSTGMYQEGDTGRTLQIFGGIDSVKLGEDVQWSESFGANGRLKDGARPAFFLKDLSSTQIIQTNVLQPPAGDTTGRVFNQRTFYVSHSEVLSQSLVGGTFSFELDSADLPWETPIKEDGSPDFEAATQAKTAYVRVLSCSNKVTSESGFRWDVVKKTSPESVMIKPVGLTLSDRSLPSEAIAVSFPTEGTDLYIQALQTAVAVMLLSRSDLVLPSAALNTALAATLEDQSTYVATGLETFAQTFLPSLEASLQDYFTSVAMPPAFGKDILAKVGVLTDMIIERQGNPPQTVLNSLSGVFTKLTQWKWSDTTFVGPQDDANLSVTILGSLDTSLRDATPTMSIAKNASSLMEFETRPLQSVSQCREKGVFSEYEYSGMGYGISTMPDSSKSAPLVVSGGSRPFTGIWYARDLITTEIYTACQQVLGLTVSENTASGGWLAFRPFQSVGTVAGVQKISTKVQDYLEAAAAGLQGGADLILNFISMLEQRVREIQELIQSIDTYLSIPLSIEIPDAVGLALVANGMDGVVEGLLSAGNKPTDGPEAYSGGLVLLGGGVPALITDIILTTIA